MRDDFDHINVGFSVCSGKFRFDCNMNANHVNDCCFKQASYTCIKILLFTLRILYFNKFICQDSVRKCVFLKTIKRRFQMVNKVYVIFLTKNLIHAIHRRSAAVSSLSILITLAFQDSTSTNIYTLKLREISFVPFFPPHLFNVIYQKEIR